MAVSPDAEYPLKLLAAWLKVPAWRLARLLDRWEAGGERPR